MKRIFIIPVGTVDSSIVSGIANGLKEKFRCEIGIDKEIPIPLDAYNNKRRQYHSTTILGELRFLKLKDFDRILGVIDVDLFVPELNFVFGEADISRGVAVISLTRLRQEFYGLHPDNGIFQMRAIKEATHEIGHTYGLGHCPNKKCIMHFSNSLRDTDIKGPGFCDICRSNLGI
ncbi:MAG: archaemetzincin family Zn-dependent metalloprotease [Nitrospirota bacterium]